MTVSWDEVRARFRDLGDGALIDIVAFDTDADDYQRLIDLIRARPDWSPRYFEDSERTQLPIEAEHIVDRVATRQCQIVICPKGTSVRGYLNSGWDRIEFDLDPDE